MGSFANWREARRRNGPVEPPFAAKARQVSLVSALSAPLNWIERNKYGAKIAATPIDPPPVFILGHWRSGTTYLHELMAQDPDVACVSHLQAMAPLSCIHRREQYERMVKRSGATRSAVERFKRPMDNMVITPDSPQEEEYAIANLCPYSLLHGWYFPKRMREHFEKYLLMDGLPDEERRAWGEVYRGIIRKAMFIAGGRRIISKNPFNTGRPAALADLFPGAKFIHIYRNPYTLYMSTRNFYREIMPIYQFQEISEEDVERRYLRFYVDIHDRLYRDWDRLPARDRMEIRYEDLVKDPVNWMEKIYSQMGFAGFAAKRPAFEAFAESKKDYKKNVYDWTPALIEKIDAAWSAYIARWGYRPPAVS